MTITYEYIKTITRPWGYEVILKFINDGEILFFENFLFKSQPSQQAVIDKATSLKEKIETRINWKSNCCTVFDDYGSEVKEPIYWLISKIRLYPTATIAQAKTLWNATWADGFINFDNFIVHMQKIIGGLVTWEQFKTYVINHNFEGLD